jgi:cyclophilin family peptidyl-prolyl cis-trans isomerase
MKLIKKISEMMILVTILASMLLVKEGISANTIVQFNVMGIYGPEGPASNFRMELFDSQVPTTVINFLHYANDHAYDNTIIHRSVPVFVVQGGCFNLAGTSAEAFPYSSPITPIVTYPPIKNEPGISNVRGTIGVARSFVPDSGTSQWYFNISDNTFLDDPNNAGGWTVFGRVLDPGMEVLDEINNIPDYDISNHYSGPGSDFKEVPLFQDNNNKRFFITVTSINVVPEPSILMIIFTFFVSVFIYAWRHCFRKNIYGNGRVLLK